MTVLLRVLLVELSSLPVLSRSRLVMIQRPKMLQYPGNHGAGRGQLQRQHLR